MNTRNSEHPLAETKKLSKTRRKLPKTAIEDLIQTCVLMGRCSKEPPKEIFNRYIIIIDKYDFYFFNKPWPVKYNFAEATTFTEEDLHFLLGTEKEPVPESEYSERIDAICLKKTISLEDSPGYWGMFWAYQALEKKLETLSSDTQATDDHNASSTEPC